MNQAKNSRSFFPEIPEGKRRSASLSPNSKNDRIDAEKDVIIFMSHLLIGHKNIASYTFRVCVFIYEGINVYDRLVKRHIQMEDSCICNIYSTASGGRAIL